MFSKVFPRILAAVLGTALFGCDSASGPEVDPVYSLQMVSGDKQSGSQGSVLSQPLVLRVVDELFRPQPNVEIRTLITEGGGVISPPISATDSQGKVKLQWTLGDSYAQGVKIWTQDQLSVFVTAEATARYRYEPPPQTGDGWPVGSLDIENAKTAAIFHGIDEIRKGTYPEVHSLLVVKGGVLLLEEYWPGHDSNGNLVAWDRDTPHEVQSASKSFRSMLVGIAIEKSFIEGVDTPIAEFFPEYAQLMEGKQKITLEHVLTMSTGLEWTEGQVPYGDPRNTLSTMYSLQPPKWAEYVLSRPLVHEPGTFWFYNTGASIMMNRIVISGTQINLGSFVRDYYTSLVESATLPGVGSPLGAVTMPRDLAKFGQVFASGGKWKDNTIISSSWVEESLAPRFTPSAGIGYGYQWWSRTLRTASKSYPVFYASGNGGQFVFLVRDLELVVVSTGGNFGSSVMNQMMPFLEKWVLPAFE